MAVPKLRFKRDDGSDYPEWRVYSISDLFNKVQNKNKGCKNTNVITNSAEYGLISQRDFFDKDIAVEGNTEKYTIIQTGDFVYNPRKSSKAPMGPFNCYCLAEEGIVSPLYSCLRPKGVLDSKYLLWYFQTNKWHGYMINHGAQNCARLGRVGMTDKILMGIPVSAPCIEEQQKIADFLFSVEEVISACKEEVANLETQKKAVMKMIFSQEVRFKKDDGSDFSEWELRKFNEVFVSFSNKKYQVQTDEYKDHGQYPIIDQGQDYCAGYTDISSALCTEVPCILFGDHTLVIKYVDMPFVVGADGVKTLHALIENSKYAYYLLQANNVKQQRYSRHFSKLNKISFMFATDTEEQKKIADFLSDFDETIAAAKKELELWKELKKGLLQQMFV